MVKLRLVRLNLREVPIVEVAGVLQVDESENDYAAALVTNGQVFARLVKVHGGKDVGVADR